MMRRDRLRTTRHLNALRRLTREHGITMWNMYFTFQERWSGWGAEDREAGTTEMHEGIALVRLQLTETFVPLMMTLLAETEAEAGRPDMGLATVDRQLATVERTGQRWFLSELHRARGEILLKCRPCDRAAAESAFTRAIDIARSQAAKLFELQAAVSLARLWVAEGKRAQARELVAPICAWFGQGLDCDALREAKALLSDPATN
jgi:predicted ATPase